MLEGAGVAFVCTECSVNKMKTRILPSFLVAGVWLATSLLLVHGVAVTNVLNGAVGTASQATGVLNAITGLATIGNQGLRGQFGHAFERIFGDVDSGTNPINFAGGNVGAYYNFMFPDNDDYPWACVCNEHDLKQFQAKELPFARCRNQEDLSYQNIQANCDPHNSANVEF